MKILKISNKIAKTFESQFDIGDAVFLEIGSKKIEGYVRTVFFTNAKVRYSVKIYEDMGNGEEANTTFHNIDSVFVTPDDSREPIEFDFIDNYS